jgi:hypothetical protein
MFFKLKPAYFQERSADFINFKNLDERLSKALEEPVVYDYAIDMKGSKLHDPPPMKYQSGVPTKQKGRLYDRTLAKFSNSA